MKISRKSDDRISNSQENTNEGSHFGDIMTLGSGIDANHSKKYRISSYSFRPWIDSAAKIQFIKEKIEILRQLFELAIIYKFKKE